MIKSFVPINLCRIVRARPVTADRGVLGGCPMNTFHLQAEDWAWVRQRLRSTAGVTLLMLGLTAAIQFRPPAPHEPGADVYRGSDADGAIAIGDGPPSGETRGRSIPPSGWRRTSRGWEHVASWPAAADRSNRPSLGERVEALEASEPVWVRHALGQLRATPPLMVALIELIAIGVICQLGRRGHHAPAKFDPTAAQRHS